ncbi:MAG: histidine kinase [Saprospiraceae bacterium]|nr:histidine kinase [Saprospiraceae bacterium]MCF8252598.1 histidine kinase [Saprospiraceae bacterium]MCF8282655.1 histidine kinase [Bacteroidales bacterium]MCF8314073.1 histidine kinase [Saprospiraceae bacterium]MCF8442943.1 histidine kinase [Saprospiraceae bacterium]
MAQQEHPSFTRFTTEHGLADNWVHTALQDSRGFLWFGTEGGLSRFDGQHFLNFYEDKNNPNSLSNNKVRDLCEDPDGSFWLATLDGGLNHFDPATGISTAWRTDSTPAWKDKDKPLSFTSILQDNGLLWLGSYDHGLGCFDKKLRRYTAWYDFPSDHHSDNLFQYNSINHIISDRQNPRYLWLAAANRGLSRFDKQTHQLEIWPIHDANGKEGVASMWLLQDKAGVIWIGTWSNGIARFDPNSSDKKMVWYPYDILSWKQVNVNRNVVLSMLETNDSVFWVATLDNGFGTFNKVSGEFKFLKNSLSGESPELDRACQGLYLDRQQRLWVLGRQQGGVRVFAPRRQAMRYISLAAGGGNAEHAEVSGFAYCPTRRTVFVATENNGCFEWSDENQRLVQRVKPLAGGTFPKFKTVHCDSKGTLWAGTAKTLGGGASLYWLKPGQTFFEPAVLKLSPPRGLEETVNDLMEDSKGYLWIATDYDGFYKVQLRTLITEYFHETKDFAQGTPNFNKWWALLNVKEDNQGKIWFVLKSGGVIEFDPVARDFKVCNQENVLPSNDLLSLETTGDNRIYIGTKNNGLLMMRPGVLSPDSLLIIDGKNGLPSQFISDVKRDKLGNLWLATDNGLAVFDPGSGHIRAYGITDGIRSLALKDRGLAIVPGLGVLIGQPNGFCLLRNEEPSKLPDATSMRVVLTDFKVFEQSNFFEKSILNAKEVILQPSENVFSFEFAVPSSLDASLVTYQFRLDGFDEKWYTATGQNSITYTQLPPGPYTFRVRALLTGQSSPETTLSICILPYWWQTSWAKFAATMALGLLFFAVYKYRTRQLKRENELLRQMNELERSALQAQMNPHFIFNCLGAIQNFILHNEKEQAMNYLGDFAQLVRGVLNASVMGKVSLQEELNLLENYLSLEQLRFDRRFDFEIKVTDGNELLDIAIPPLLIQPYVENAVLHGMAGKKCGGKVEVLFRKKENYLEVTVRDNGQGLASSGSPKTHKSVGMSVTRRRLEMLNSISKTGAVEVNQLSDETGKINGTEVKILIEFVKQENV